MERTDINRVENDGLSLGPTRLARVAEALEVSVLELRPEAAPDDRGLNLLDLLAKLAKADVEIQANQEKALLEQQRILRELRELRAALEIGRSAPTAPPKRRVR